MLYLLQPKNSSLTFEEDAEMHSAYYLDQWLDDIRMETIFYRKVNSIMRRLDMNSMGEKSFGYRFVSILQLVFLISSFVLLKELL